MNKHIKRIIFNSLSQKSKLLYGVRSVALGCYNHHILVSAMMKCGGTYLTKVLASLPQFKSVRHVPGCGRREQEISILKLLLNRRNYIAHHHVRYSETTNLLIKIFNIKPIILVRNIFDVIVSMRDYIRKGHIVNQMVYIFPEMAISMDDNLIRKTDNISNGISSFNSKMEQSSLKEYDDEFLTEFLIDLFIPWYFNFFLSWMECKDKILITYEEMNRDMFPVLERIAKNFELNVSEIDISNAISLSSKSDTRLNKGIIGRGSDISPKLKDKVFKYARYYENVDFSPIGITNR